MIAVRYLLAFASFLLLSSTAWAQISYTNFSTTTGSTLLASSARVGNVVRLTTGPNEKGALWYNTKQLVSKGFVTRFSFRISDVSGQEDDEGLIGGDGIVFVIQNASTSAIGDLGGLLGYDGIPNSIAIEFDTFKNREPYIGDANGNHVGVHTVGTSPNSASERRSLRTATIPQELNDGEIHTATIEYHLGYLRVYLDACAPPLIELPIDLPRTLSLDNGTAWVGFTSASAASWQKHDLLSWRFQSLGARVDVVGSLCDVDSVRLTAATESPSYRWSTGEMTRSIVVRSSGSYTLTVVDTGACSGINFTTTENVTLGTRPRPLISVTGSRAICAGSNVTLSVAGGYSRYTWSTGETSPTITVGSAGTYWVNVRDKDGCDGVSDTVAITVLPRPSPTVSVIGPQEFCRGDSVVLRAPAGMLRYRWSTGDTLSAIFVRESGDYMLTVTGSNGCDSTSAPVRVVVHEPPVVAVSPPTSTICEGDRIILDAGVGFARYLWSTGDTTRTITVRGAGEFTVSVIDSFGCQATSTAASVSVRPAPKPGVDVFGALQICEGERVELEAASGFIDYRWSNGATGRRIVVDRPGAYTVTVIDANGCVGVSDTVRITSRLLSGVAIIVDGPLRFCDGDSVTLRAPSGFARYRWSDGSESMSTVVRTGGRVLLTLEDSSGCRASDSVDITVVARPAVSIAGGGDVCSGESTRLVASGGERYRWTPSLGLDCDTCASVIASPSRTTTYTVVATNGGICESSATVDIVVTPGVTVSAGADRTICAGASTTLRAEGGSGSYSWSPSASLSCSDCSAPMATPAVTTEYVVTYVAEGGCSARDTVVVFVADEPIAASIALDSSHAFPGSDATLWLTLAEAIDEARVQTIEVELTWNELVARYLSAGDDQSLLNGWSVTRVDSSAGRVRLRFVAPPGNHLRGRGRLAPIRFALYLADTLRTPVGIAMSVDGERCVSLASSPGLLTVDSICGASWRLIEVGATRYALGESRPNPSNGTSTIDLSLGLDGPTVLRLFDLNGREVARLLDNHMEAGEYQVELSGVARGVYLYRLESGDYIESRTLIVR